jgi:hypothetical protein
MAAIVAFGVLFILVWALRIAIRGRSQNRFLALFFIPIAAGLMLAPVNYAIWGVAFIVIALIFVPSYLFRRADTHEQAGEYEKVRDLYQPLRWLHPFLNWKQVDDLLAVSILLRDGHWDKAADQLVRIRTRYPHLEAWSYMQQFYMRADWPALRQWVEANLPPDKLRRDLTTLLLYLRSLGETGDLDKLLVDFGQYRNAIERSPQLRDQAYMYVLAFTGRLELLERLVKGEPATLPAHITPPWLASAEQAAGKLEAAQARLEAFLRDALPALPNPIRHYLESTARRRQAAPLAPPGEFSPPAQQALQELERWVELGY